MRHVTLDFSFWLMEMYANAIISVYQLQAKFVNVTSLHTFTHLHTPKSELHATWLVPAGTQISSKTHVFIVFASFKSLLIISVLLLIKFISTL